MKRLVSFSIQLIFCLVVSAQVYTEKQTRHRFAQLNLGADFQSSFGGESKYIDETSAIKSLAFSSVGRPRFIIGGTHFWGHADFYIAIPVWNPTYKKDAQDVAFSSGVETVFKYYPWRIEHKKLRPFIGISIAPYYFEHTNNYLELANGPELNHTSVPLMTGFTANHKNHLIELGLSWNYLNRQDYWISTTDRVNIETPPFYFNLSYRYMLETTLSAEKNWENGKTQQLTDQLAAVGKLNGLSVGVGMSSAFWLNKGRYNETSRPFIETYSTSIMPEFGLGYYWHKPDLNLNLSYRQYKGGTSTYGFVQTAKRQSLGLELTKFLFDYHGFVPFVGGVLSAESLQFQEYYDGGLVQNTNQNKLSGGIAFGWDIRPNRVQTWLLRTNLRYYPKLNLDVANQGQISFSNLEFNFIQLVVYPSRMMK